MELSFALARDGCDVDGIGDGGWRCNVSFYMVMVDGDGDGDDGDGDGDDGDGDGGWWMAIVTVMQVVDGDDGDGDGDGGWRL